MGVGDRKRLVDKRKPLSSPILTHQNSTRFAEQDAIPVLNTSQLGEEKRHPAVGLWGSKFSCFCSISVIKNVFLV